MMLREASYTPCKRQLRQTTLDGLTSLENGPSTPKKWMVVKLQVGGAPAKHTEYWKTPEIESALKYTALNFRKACNSNSKKEILQRLKEAIHSMRLILEGQTRVKAEAVKWYQSPNMNFCKPWRQERSGCYILPRGVQVHQHPRTRLPISCTI